MSGRTDARQRATAVGSAAERALPRIAFVVPTKDRPAELRRMLASLAEQDVQPAQVVVVDATREGNDGIEQEFPGLTLRRIAFQGRPSAAGQRNAGAAAVDPSTDLICFIDDDTVVCPGSLRAMLEFWAGADPAVGGASFNVVNEIDRRPALVKRSALVEWLGLYSREPGRVAPSGWHSPAGVVKEDLEVEWLTSCAVVWRRALFADATFDEFFEGYSYLEDLEFSYRLGRDHGLVVVADAELHHHPSPHGRVSMYRFGLVEARNRLYFVEKYGLSIPRCYAAQAVRSGMSLILGVVQPWKGGLARAAGNLRSLLAYRRPPRTGA